MYEPLLYIPLFLLGASPSMITTLAIYRNRKIGFAAFVVLLISSLVGGSFAASFLTGSPDLSAFRVFLILSVPLAALGIGLNAWGRYKRRHSAS